ncbi:MAG: GNAT family N-acetyltransferase [Alteraurantiacibacter sp.]
MADFQHETQRLVLRDWREDDWADFWELTNTPAVMRWLGGVANEATRAGAMDRLAGYRRNFGHTFWVMERKDDGGYLAGEMLGFCGLKRANLEDTPVFDMVEIGWRMREDAWGRGYAKEAAIASLGLGFEKFGAEIIIALTVAGNRASWGLMRKVGMTRRSDLDYEDVNWPAELNPTIVYAITAQEWAQRVDD